MISPRTVVFYGNLLLLGLASYLAAALTMEQVGRYLATHTPQVRISADQVAPVKAQAKLPITVFNPVLEANIFQAERAPVVSSSQNPGKATGITSTPLPQALPQSLPKPNILLTGTMIFGSRTYATVTDASGQNEKLYKPGECLPASLNTSTSECDPTQSKLVSVTRNSIQVIFQGRPVIITLAEKPTNMDLARNSPPIRPPPSRDRNPRRGIRPSVSAAMSPKNDAAMSRIQSHELYPSVRRGNSIEVRLPKVEVDRSMQNFSDVLKQARVVPYSAQDGTGFQIRSIRSGSIFQRIGLVNFDVIKAVNGQPLTTADQALSLFTLFRNEKEVTLDVRRRNIPMKLHFIIE